MKSTPNLIAEELARKRDKATFDQLLTTGPLTRRLDLLMAELAKDWATSRSGP